MSLTEKISHRLKVLLDYELGLGNPIEELREEDGTLTVLLAGPLHHTAIERDLSLPPTVVPCAIEGFDGYLCRITKQRLLAPRALQGDKNHAVPDLSPLLQALYDTELQRDNTVESVYRDPNSDRVMVRFTKPLHTTDALPPGLSSWECWDSHYPLEGGFLCEASGHSLSGPLALFERLKLPLQGIVACLLEKDFEALRGDGIASAAVLGALKKALDGEQLAPIPESAYSPSGPHTSLLARPQKGRKGPPWDATLFLWTGDPQPARSAIYLELVVSESGPDLKLKIRRVVGVPDVDEADFDDA